MEKPNGSNNKTGSAGMKAYDLEIPLQLDARCPSWAHPGHVGQEKPPIPGETCPAPYGLT